MTRLSIRDRIREIQDDDIDSVLRRHPIRVPSNPHTKTFGVFMEDAEAAARLKVDQAGEVEALADKHEREKDQLKDRHERENERQKDKDDSEKESEANAASRETNEAFSKKQAKGKDIAKKMMKSKTMKAFAKKVAKMSKVSPSELDKILPDYVSGGDIGALFSEELGEEANLQEEMIQDFEIRFDKESDWKKAGKMVTDYLKKDVPKHAKALLTKTHVIGPDPMMVAVGDTKQKLKPPVNLNKLYNAIRKLPSSRMKYWQAIPKKQEKDALGEETETKNTSYLTWNNKIAKANEGTMGSGIFDDDKNKAKDAARKLVGFLRANREVRIETDPENPKKDSKDLQAYTKELTNYVFDDQMLDDLIPDPKRNKKNYGKKANDIVTKRLKQLGVNIR